MDGEQPLCFLAIVATDLEALLLSAIHRHSNLFESCSSPGKPFTTTHDTARPKIDLRNASENIHVCIRTSLYSTLVSPALYICFAVHCFETGSRTETIGSVNSGHAFLFGLIMNGGGRRLFFTCFFASIAEKLARLGSHYSRLHSNNVDSHSSADPHMHYHFSPNSLGIKPRKFVEICRWTR